MASHPSPFYRNRQSNKALDPNGPTAKFLYTILKQLDLKNIDWNEVASGLDITNGHAARMRWSRFRAQIEGLDNSYSRQSGKKRDGEKKRKKEKAGEDTIAKEAVHQKRVKGELVQGSGEDTALQLDIYGDSEMPTAVKSERPEKTSTVDGITVHHPKMTTIEVSQPAQKGPMIKQDPFATASSTSLPVDGRVSKSVASGPPATYPCYPHSYEPDLQWSQHLSNPNHLYQYSTTANPWGYQPVLSSYTSCYQYPGVYAGQNGQQRFVYGQNQPRISAQQPNYYPYNGNGFRMPATTPNMHDMTVPQTPSRLSTQVQSAVSKLPSSTKSSPPETNNQTQTTAQICELANEASYPWPYSEALLADMTRKGCEVHNDGCEGGNLIDLSDTDAEHVIDPDLGIHERQSNSSASNAAHKVGTHNYPYHEHIITTDIVQQAKTPGISTAQAPESIACPPSLPLETVKSEPEL